MRIKPWQVAVLVAPIVIIVLFLMIAAGQQIRSWGLNWIWAIVVFVLLGWRWLLVRWTRPAFAQAEALVSEATAELEAELEAVTDSMAAQAADDAAPESSVAQVEAALRQTLSVAQEDPPIWEDWMTFWQRCLSLVTAVSRAYHPSVKRPLLNIYVPEAYGLIRGTVEDTDRMMQKLSPVLSQVSIGQMVEGVEVYRKLEPSARKVIKAVNWAQWVFNPVAAAARQSSAKFTGQANQQLLLNLSNMLRETVLRNLAQQAVALYGGGAKVKLDELTAAVPAIAPAKTQTLQDILERAEPIESVAQKPVNILLVGRTGAGKSSVINTLFRSERAAVDVLPSTDKIQSYRWQLGGPTDGPTGKPGTEDALTLWDTPGYEQVDREDLRDRVINYATNADALLLVTPALDPALQMDADFLAAMRAEVDALPEQTLPIIAVVTQVDKLRPIREWSPPYYWETGAWPKEVSIREAVVYRAEKLGDYCDQVLPLVTGDGTRVAWGDDALAATLLEAIAPAKQLRLARFLRSRTAQTTAAAKIIDRYAGLMSTTEGLTKLLKSPVLQLISTWTTGNPAVGALLSESIPVEEVPMVLGKLQMAYELYSLLSDRQGLQSVSAAGFDLMMLWPLLLDNGRRETGYDETGYDETGYGETGHSPGRADQRAWALGHALTEYWTQDLPIGQVSSRVDFYLAKGT